MPDPNCTSTLKFPLTEGEDGWFPPDDKCICCHRSLVKPKERVRLFVGITADVCLSKGEGAGLNVYWYGQQQEGRTDGGLRAVQVFGQHDNTENVVEFCSTKCLRQFFNAIVDGLE